MIRRRGKHIRDLTGQRFGLLTALYPTPQRIHGSVVWHCRCECGNEVDATSNNLTQGSTSSCGCGQRRQQRQPRRRHQPKGEHP